MTHEQNRKTEAQNRKPTDKPCAQKERKDPTLYAEGECDDDVYEDAFSVSRG